MTIRCVGCGSDVKDGYLGSVLLYGGVGEMPDIHSRATVGNAGIWTAEYAKTLCPRCQKVLKDIILNSNLSDHWHKYDWESEKYTECYDE